MNERFEVINWLYYRDTGHMRPGKDDPTMTISREENASIFAAWCQEGLFERALKAIHEKDMIIEAVQKYASILELDMENYTTEQVFELNEAMGRIQLVVGA